MCRNGIPTERPGKAAGEGTAQLQWMAQDIVGAGTIGTLPRTAAGVEWLLSDPETWWMWSR